METNFFRIIFQKYIGTGKKYKNKTKYSLIKQTNCLFFIVVYFGCFKTRSRVIRLLHHLDSCFTQPILMRILYIRAEGGKSK